MNEESLDNGPERWVSITGKPLDLGLHDSGFQGTRLQMHLRT